MTMVLLHARRQRDIDGHPYWACRILSPSTSTDGDFRILVENKRRSDCRIYGILVWKDGAHHLVLPDKSNSFVGDVEHFILNVNGKTEQVW